MFIVILKYFYKMGYILIEGDKLRVCMCWLFLELLIYFIILYKD